MTIGKRGQVRPALSSLRCASFSLIRKCPGLLYSFFPSFPKPDQSGFRREEVWRLETLFWPPGRRPPRSEKIRKPRFSDFSLSSPPGRRGERYTIKDASHFNAENPGRAAVYGAVVSQGRVAEDHGVVDLGVVFDAQVFLQAGGEVFDGPGQKAVPQGA